MTTTGQTFNINTLSNYSFLSNDGDKEIILSNQGLILKRDLLTTPIETIITPLDITDTNTGNTITMDKLTYLPIGLASLEPPPNATTLNINNTILLDSASTPNVNYSTLSDNDLLITNTTTGEQTYIQKNDISLRNQNTDTANMFLDFNGVSSDLTFNVSNGIINLNNNVNVGGSMTQVDYIEGLIGNNLEISSPNTKIVFQTSGVARLSIGNTGAWDIQGGSSYNNATNTWTATTFNGTATNVTATSDNTSGTYYLPFTKTSGSGSKLLFIDDVTGPLTYNPSTSTLTAITFNGTATNATNVNVVATNTTNTNYNVNFSSASGNTNIRSDTDLIYNPSTNLLTTPNLTASTKVNTPLIENSSGNVELKCNTSGAGGSIILTGGTGLLAATAGGASGQHLVLTINGTQYKIALLNP